MTYSSDPHALSAIMLRENSLVTPQAHSAALSVVGWAGRNGRGELCVGQVPVYSINEKWLGKRVRATLYPHFRHERMTACQVANVRKARPNESNSAEFRVVGHLVRLDRATQKMVVEIYPQSVRIPRFQVYLRLTGQAGKTCDSGWTGIEVRGSLLDRMLLVEQVLPAYAPIAEHWGRPGRLKQRVKRTLPEE